MTYLEKKVNKFKANMDAALAQQKLDAMRAWQQKWMAAAKQMQVSRVMPQDLKIVLLSGLLLRRLLQQ